MQKDPVAALSKLGARTLGVFRGVHAVGEGVSRDQLRTLRASGVIDRMLHDTYRMTVVAPSHEQSLRAALMWAGSRASAAARSAGYVYGLEGVTADRPEIEVPPDVGRRHDGVVIHRTKNRASLRTRSYRGFRVTGVEPTLMLLAHILDDEAFEIACEDARRRKLTSMRALQNYVAQYGGPGRPGSSPMKALLDQLDPAHPSRSTLEVKTRRLLVAHGITDFVREFPLEWNGRRYRYDFCFEPSRTILETNGKAPVTATASCSQPGERSPATRISCSRSSDRHWRRESLEAVGHTRPNLLQSGVRPAGNGAHRGGRAPREAATNWRCASR